MKSSVLDQGACDETKENGGVQGDDDNRDGKLGGGSDAERVGLRSSESNKYASSNKSAEN